MPRADFDGEAVQALERDRAVHMEEIADEHRGRIVEALTWWPSLSSSPWIRWYPQAGFSLASRPVSVLISALTGCRPVRCGYVHFLATRRRCHRRTVPGVTSRCARSVLGRCRISAVSTARSAQPIRGLGWVLRKIAASWRSTSSSVSLDAERPGRAGRAIPRAGQGSGTAGESTRLIIMPDGQIAPGCAGHSHRPTFETPQATFR